MKYRIGNTEVVTYSMPLKEWGFQVVEGEFGEFGGKDFVIEGWFNGKRHRYVYDQDGFTLTGVFDTHGERLAPSQYAEKEADEAVWGIASHFGLNH